MTGSQGDSIAATGRRRQPLDQITDIDEWLDALGDELADEFPDLVEEASGHVGKPVSDEVSSEQAAAVRETGPGFKKRRASPGEWAVWLFVVGCVVAKVIVWVVRW